MQFSKLILLVCVQCSSAAVKRNFLGTDQLESAQSHSMLHLHPYYHSTVGIHDELTQLATRCPAMSLESKDADGRSIDVVTIKAANSNPINKNFLLFGEHARELISPESGLHFIKTLCGETGELNKERATKTLQDSEFQIVVNGNPASRTKVEQGDFCLRVNPNGVDLNRNWDEEWSPVTVMDSVDTNPGEAPFSEAETKVFKELVSNYKPTNFLTVHSGTKGMYMPWAYDMEHLATRNQKSMIEILKSLDKDHCECPFGAAGKEVGYSCPGTCLDWVYDKLNTPYAFAFEIYTNPDMNPYLKERWEDKMKEQGASFLQLTETLGNEKFKDFFQQTPSDFVQVRSESGQEIQLRENTMSADECFTNFNPDSQERYTETVQNWSEAYLDMADEVAKKLKGSDTPLKADAKLMEEGASVEHGHDFGYKW